MSGLSGHSRAEAAELFDTDTAVDIHVVPRVDDGAPLPWSMKLRPRKSAVVTHYHRPSGSVARIVQLEFSQILTNSNRRGSFFRRKVSDFIWPADHVKYAPKTRALRTVILPDGGTFASLLERQERETGEKVITRHRDIPRKPRWMVYPLFGEWGPLLDPWFGTPPAE